MKLRFSIVLATVALVWASACNKADYPILYPDWDQSPAWAVKACGAHPVLCSDGGCCSAGFTCSADRFLPMYRQPGFCEYNGTW